MSNFSKRFILSGAILLCPTVLAAQAEMVDCAVLAVQESGTENFRYDPILAASGIDSIAAPLAQSVYSLEHIGHVGCLGQNPENSAEMLWPLGLDVRLDGEQSTDAGENLTASALSGKGSFFQGFDGFQIGAINTDTAIQNSGVVLGTGTATSGKGSKITNATKAIGVYR